MPNIPNARKKLREAEFFLRKLQERERDSRLDRERFDFYLNAFLAAFRSVTLVWQFEDKVSYDARYEPWKKNRSQAEQELMKFMNDQRVGVIHRKGTPELEREIEYVDALSASSPSGSGGNSPPLGWLLMVGFENATTGMSRHYFKIGDRRAAVVDVCMQGIELLRDLLQ